MQISIHWINELVDTKLIQIEYFIEKLTLGGFEVEETLEIDINDRKQIILDVSATANRSDSLSIQGISNEISALLDQSIKISKYINKNSEWKQEIEKKLEILSSNFNCQSFLTFTVKNLTDLEAPNWMKQKIQSAGISTSNNFLDFQTYLLLETGYPFVFYDFEKISSKLDTSNFILSVETHQNLQNFLASNNSNYSINDEITMVTANQIPSRVKTLPEKLQVASLPISISGIIEAKEFMVTNTTKTLLIEGSIFSAAQIRQQSRKLGLRTDRSARYEKSLKYAYLMDSFYRLLYLLKISNPNLVCQVHTFQKTCEQTVKPILLQYKTIHEILGPIKKNKFISPALINEYLARLNFKFQYEKSTLNWLVNVPNSRSEDITREIDLIEEIGRLHGFNNFLTTLPKIRAIGQKDSHYKIRSKITNCLLNLGLNEVLHYSLASKKKLVTNEISLINPLFKDYSNLRISLLPNLIETVQENLKQKNIFFEGFEYGHVFFKNGVNKMNEKELISGIFGSEYLFRAGVSAATVKTKLSWTNENQFLSWFEAKGKIETFFKQLNLTNYWEPCVNQSMKNLFHPYRRANICDENFLSLGHFGQINPILANQLNLPLELYLFEFEFEKLQYQIQNNKLIFHQNYSTYPKIIKNLTFIIQRDITFHTIQKLLYLNGTEFLFQIQLLDEYRGSEIPQDYTSLCLELVFQSNQKTLKNKKIEIIIKQLKLVLSQKLNATIRD